MYKEQLARVSSISNMDRIALVQAVNEIITDNNVLDITYATLQKEPNVYEYVAFITVKE